MEMGSHKRSKDLHFNFILDRVNVDWQSINAVDIDLLVRRVDVGALQEHLRDVTLCRLDSVQCQQCLTPVDPSLLKLFRLAQLSLQWLDYCQKRAVFNINTMEKRLIKSDKECQKLQKKNKQQEEKMKGMGSELKSRRLIIQKQQSLFAKEINNGIQCQLCEKKYLNTFFLQKHMLRRHPDQCQNLTDQIAQRDSEIKNLRMQLSQAAKEHDQRLQEAQNMQQEKTKLHYEKEKLKLEKSAMQVEADLQRENFKLVIENQELEQENLDLRTKNGQLEQENLDLRTENGQLEQENLDLRTENGQMEQDKLELRREHGQLEQENLKLRRSNGQLQQENLDLKTANRELQCKNQELSTGTRKLQQQNLSLLSRREEEKLMLEVEDLQKLTMKLQQENLALESQNRNLKEENQVTSASSSLSPTQLPEPVLKNTPRSQDMKSPPQGASLVPNEQSEQESKTLNHSENLSGGGDGDSPSPEPTSAPETPDSAISKSSLSSIDGKSGKKQRKSFFQRCYKELCGMWHRPLAAKHAP